MENFFSLTADGFLSASPRPQGRPRALLDLPTDLDACLGPASFVTTGPIHDQSQSPLFSTLPPELRNEIFRHALHEYVRPDVKPWPYATFFTRPGYDGIKTVDCDLLRTCKLIYEETKNIPLRDLEVSFYFGWRSRVPPLYTDALIGDYPDYEFWVHPRTLWFTPEHWKRIRTWHVFGQMFSLEPCFRMLARDQGQRFVPEQLVVTLRYTDWWNWETDAPCDTNQFFPMNDCPIPESVRRVVVEFETIEKKEKELDIVVASMFSDRQEWVWNRTDGKTLYVKGNAIEGAGIETSSWWGPTSFSITDSDFSHHGKGDTMRYVVKVLEWEIAGE